MVNYVDGIPNDDFHQPQYRFGANNKTLSVDDHFAFFKGVCDYVSEYYVIKKARRIYDTTKYSCGLIDRTLTKVENGAQSALDYTAPIYETYVFPTTNRLFTVYDRSLENTKAVAATTGTLTFGLAVVSAQVTLAAGALFSRLILDGIIDTKEKGKAVFSNVIAGEKYVECIRITLLNTAELVKSPSAKLGDYSNTLLDVGNSVLERIFSLPPAVENPESTIAERIRFLAARVVSGVTETANRKVVEPCQVQFAIILEQLQKSLIVVEYLKCTKAWTFEKVDQATATTAELRSRIEAEAKQVLTKPEDTLIRYIHEMSKALIDNVQKLRESGELVFNDKLQVYVQETLDYVTELSSILQNADDLYSANSEVVDEVKKRLFKLTQWYKEKSQNDKEQ